MIVLPFNTLWKNKEFYENMDKEEMNKKEKNLKMVAKMIKKEYPNINQMNAKIMVRNFIEIFV